MFLGDVQESHSAFCRLFVYKASDDDARSGDKIDVREQPKKQSDRADEDRYRRAEESFVQLVGVVVPEVHRMCLTWCLRMRTKS